MEVEFGVHELNEMIDGDELVSHPTLVPEEVAFHLLHELTEGPEGHCVVLHYGVNGREEIGHALDVAEGGVVFVIGDEHVFHLFEVDVGADLGEG